MGQTGSCGIGCCFLTVRPVAPRQGGAHTWQESPLLEGAAGEQVKKKERESTSAPINNPPLNSNTLKGCQ